MRKQSLQNLIKVTYAVPPLMKKSRTSTLLLRDAAEDGAFLLWSKRLISRLMS